MQEMMDDFTSAGCRVEVGGSKGGRAGKAPETEKKARFPLINLLVLYDFIFLRVNLIETLHHTLILILIFHSNDAYGNHILNSAILSQKTHGNRYQLVLRWPIPNQNGDFHFSRELIRL